MFRSIIRTNAFIRKELVEVLRQPRLLLILVIGPFFILFLFGLGYRNEGRILRTLYVVSDGNPIRDEIAKVAPRIGPQLEYQGIVKEEQEAKAKLRRNEVDLVVVAPADAAQAIRENRQAVFHIYHNEIDPYQADYIRFTGELYVDKLNHVLLSGLAEEKKADVSIVEQDLRLTTQAVKSMRIALEQKNPTEARKQQHDLEQRVAGMDELIRGQLGLMDVRGTEAQGISALSSGIRRDLSTVKIEENEDDYSSDIRNLAKAEIRLSELQTKLAEVRRINPGVLLAPFKSRTEGIVTVQPKLSQYFTPGVIILLLQHLALTFAAVSMVREFRSSTVELFHIAPVRSSEILIGKYIGYLLLGGFIAALLTPALVFGLKVPMLGNWWSYAFVLAAVLFTSLGIGFVIALISKSDTQAIQYAMIFLLTSVFFSGFLLSLERISEPVRYLSWLLPATYGIQLMQSIMLRGFLKNFVLLAVLFSAGIILFCVSLRLLHRRLREL